MCGYIHANVNMNLGGPAKFKCQRTQNCTQIKQDHQFLSCLISGILRIKLPFFTHSCVGFYAHINAA